MKFFRTIKTFVVIDIAWAFFRADTVLETVNIIKRSFCLSNIGLIFNDGLYNLGLGVFEANVLVVSLVALFIAGYMKEKGINNYEWLQNQNVAFRYIVYWSAIFAIIISLDVNGNEFIYFQF